MRKKIIAAATAAASALAVGAAATAGTPARAASSVQPLNASAWQKVFLHSSTGAGCASYIGGIGTQIFSENCSSANWWQWRDLSRTSGAVQAGDVVEYAASDFSSAIYWSPTGGWESAPGNDNTTVQIVGNISGGWQGYWDNTLHVGMYPKANNNAIGAPASWTNPPNSWIPCPLTNPTCSPPGLPA